MSRLVSFSLATVLLALVHGLEAQITSVFQPGAADGRDAVIFDLDPTLNNNTYQCVHAEAWTFGGAPGIKRSLFQFDLSGLPVGTTVFDARLSLSYAPQPDGDAHASLEGSNESLVKRITSSWDDATVTWLTRPSTTSTNEVVLPESITTTQDYLDIDVTAMVQDMIDNPSASYGFQLELVTETQYKRLVFASSDFADASKHPKLVIVHDGNSSIDVTQASDGGPSVYPNPFTQQTTIKFENPGVSRLQLRNVNGTVVREYGALVSDQLEIKRGELAAGVYLYSLYSEDKLLGGGKLVIQ